MTEKLLTGLLNLGKTNKVLFLNFSGGQCWTVFHDAVRISNALKAVIIYKIRISLKVLLWHLCFLKRALHNPDI